MNSKKTTVSIQTKGKVTSTIPKQVPKQEKKQTPLNFPLQKQQLLKKTNNNVGPVQSIAQKKQPQKISGNNMIPKINNPKGKLQKNIQQKIIGSIRLLNNKEQDKDKEVVAVIVTINSGGSYDHLFAQVEQKSLEGTRVLVYQATTSYIRELIKAYEGNPANDVTKQMMQHIAKVHPDCVVFNWECCGAYCNRHFVEGKQDVFKFLKMILDKGHMAMFSDFSLKALITDWDQTLLGPNPFVRTAETSKAIDMRFKPGELKECPSAQLQIVGEMAEGGYCNIAVMDMTICYSINPDKLKHEFYKLQVLSISTKSLPQNKKYECELDGVKGSACHALLTFPSGGMILTSMGHWIELMKIDTSEKKLFEVAEINFGKGYADKMKQEFASLKVEDQKNWISKNAVSFIQKQAPCSNMKKKAMKNL